RLHHLLLAAALGLGALGAQAQTAAAPAATATTEYRLGAGDVVRIQVYQNPDLTLETRVSETGVISFPLLGHVRIGGRTISSAERL
ncbi:polysaccharide biosynthesis/export family protein, partial [Streptococcus pyogenes]